ncbi:hypothetical protein JCM1840_001677 [Sporobolomyces johnsonii]
MKDDNKVKQAEQVAQGIKRAEVEPDEGYGADSVDEEDTHSLGSDVDAEAAPSAVLPGDLPIFADTDFDPWPYGLGVRSDKLVLYPTSDSEGEVPDGCGTISVPLDDIAFIRPAEKQRRDPGTRYNLEVLERSRSRSRQEGPPLPSLNGWEFVLDASCPASKLSSLHPALERVFVPLPPSGVEPRPTLAAVALNPACGSYLARPYFYHIVKFWLEGAVHWAKEGVRETKKEKDGERIGRELVESWRAEEGEERKTVLVMGGDGTVHEVLNGMLLGEEGEGDKEAAKVLVDLIVIPCGTANALYHHLCPPESSLYPVSSPLSPFYSLLSFLRHSSSSSSSPLPLALAHNTILPSPASSSKSKTVLTSVVSSAALHACLLHDAESLRATMPGLERFKVAAQKNVKRWWDGRLRLFGNVRRYDPQQKSLVPAAASSAEEEKDLELEGPFAYLVSSLVSRFEPTFVVAPLRSPLSPLAPSPTEKPSIDLVLIRPLRHRPTAELVKKGKDDEAKTGFAERVWGVTAGMYDGGRHVDMRYEAGEGAEDAEQGEGEEGRTSVVEVYRCEGFEWAPTSSSDLKSNLVCLDGALHDLGDGGKLRTVALGFAETGVRVWS